MIAEKDKYVMSRCYDHLPDRLSLLSADNLISNMEWRIYTEWCCNPKESVWEDHYYYKGEGFFKWIFDETHFAIERAGFAWDNDQGRFNAVGDFTQMYEEMRQKVLQASVKRAVEFFKDCSNYQWPIKGDTRNLRTSLEPYITRI